MGINMRQGSSSGAHMGPPNSGSGYNAGFDMSSGDFQQSQQYSGYSKHNSLNMTNSSLSGSSNQNFRVVIRVRPPLQREKIHGCQFRPVV